MELINKPIGQTPLDALNDLRRNNPKYLDSKLAYAGRLDPMAHGLLMVLVDEECNDRDRYQEMDKEYEFDVLFGFKTDTYDVLGIGEYVEKPDYEKIDSYLADNLQSYTGKFEQPYPPFSSFNVNGRPLLYWARTYQLDKIQIPTKEIEIYSLEQLETYTLSKKELKDTMIKRINLVYGDFRQEEIKDQWDEIFENLSIEEFKIYKFKAKVSSGTYVRSLVNRIGKDIGCGAVAYDINRTKVGEFEIK